MTASLAYAAVAGMERALGPDPMEPAPLLVDEPCSACDGVGRVANDDTDSLYAPMWRDCAPCDGTGQRGAA